MIKTQRGAWTSLKTLLRPPEKYSPPENHSISLKSNGATKYPKKKAVICKTLPYLRNEDETKLRPPSNDVIYHGNSFDFDPMGNEERATTDDGPVILFNRILYLSLLI